jgi:LacI family transcriptional regulator
VGITTKDLAQICGVSRTTVHRALSGVGRINPDTKEMILRAAKENDYRPDLLARGLVKGRTYNIGIVVLDVKNRYFAEMLSVIGAEANRQGYCMNIMLHNNDRELEKEQLTRLAAYHTDGIILSSVNEGEAYREFLESLNVPIVSVDNKIVDGIPFVGIDQKNAMKDAARFILAKGYERIVYVCPPLKAEDNENKYVHRERLKGFQEACREYPNVETEYLLDWQYLDHVETMLPPDARTAFLCAADSFALDIMKKLRKAGKEAPTDYGIMGFDNIDTLDYVSPHLATVSNGVEKVAIEAARLLFELIETGEGSAQNMGSILPYELIAGETI